MKAGLEAQPEVLQASNIQDDRHVGTQTADSHVIQHHVMWTLRTRAKRQASTSVLE
jgi:hypothetical protein